MGYSKEVYEAVNRLLEQRRRKATREAEERKNRIYRQFPRIGEIQREFSSTAIQAARAVLGGQNAAQQLANLKDHNLALQQEQASILRQAGIPLDDLDIHYQCPLCQDEGYIDGVMCSCMTVSYTHLDVYKRQI